MGMGWLLERVLHSWTISRRGKYAIEGSYFENIPLHRSKPASRSGRREEVAALVGASARRGKSQVLFMNYPRKKALIEDAFHNFIESRFITIELSKAQVFVGSLIYVAFWLFYAILYYLSAVYDGRCLETMDTFNAAFVFSISVHVTVGYGRHSIAADCRSASTVVAIQTLFATLMDSFAIGFIFARLKTPTRRKHTVFISNTACITKRDGVVKFIFRIADIRERRVLNPNVNGVVYKWWHRTTPEGEEIPVRVDPINLHYIGEVNMLPVTIEHIIDENSPLYGETHESLKEAQAEIVISFSGTIDSTGLLFVVRQSYLPHEVRWGHVFHPAISRAREGDATHQVVLSRFHDTVPLNEFSGPVEVDNEHLAREIMKVPRGTIPQPSSRENSILFSDTAIIARKKETPRLIIRIGDARASTLRNQLTLKVCARLFLTVLSSDSELMESPTLMRELKVRAHGRDDRNEVLLRTPICLEHVIDEESPLASVMGESGQFLPAYPLISVFAQGWQYGGTSILSQKHYSLHEVQWDKRFSDVIIPPSESESKKLEIDWDAFHKVDSIKDSDRAKGQRRISIREMAKR